VNSRTPALAILLLSSLTLMSCTESNQSRSQKIAANAKSSAKESQLTISKRNPDVHVARTDVINGDGGVTVVAVELKNSGPEQLNVPLVFDGYGKSKKSLYRNNQAGLQEALQRVGSIPAGKTVWWVNDQVPVPEIKRIRAKVGAGTSGKKLPDVSVGRGRLVNDPDGQFYVGTVQNRSSSAVSSLPLYAVGLSGGKVVAAGRAIVQRLGPSGRANYRILLAGKPAGAQLSIYAAPKPI
jgi:hypothetical protein